MGSNTKVRCLSDMTRTIIISVALLSSLCIQAQSRKDGYVDKTTRQQADYAGVKAKARGEEVADQIRLVPLNGKGNVKTNRSTVDQLIKKGNGNYKVVETKLTEGTSKLSKGQEAVQEHVKSVKKIFL